MSSDMDNNPDSLSSSDLADGNLFTLSLVSALVYLSLALLIFYFSTEHSLAGAFAGGYSVTFQIAAGLVAGTAGAVAIGFAIKHPPVSRVLYDYYLVRIISEMRFSLFDRLHLSFFAGTGEELLFRGAIQPLLGVWWTSVIFIGLHGYFKFGKIGHYLFGAVMFGLSVGLGFLFEYVGLIAAMSAHASYDLIMLGLVRKQGDQKEARS